MNVLSAFQRYHSWNHPRANSVNAERKYEVGQIKRTDRTLDCSANPYAEGAERARTTTDSHFASYALLRRNSSGL